MTSDDMWLFAATGGKCNKPPTNATAEAKRVWRNKLAQRRRIEHREKDRLGYPTLEEYRKARQDAFINKTIIKEYKYVD